MMEQDDSSHGSECDVGPFGMVACALSAWHVASLVELCLLRLKAS